MDVVRGHISYALLSCIGPSLCYTRAGPDDENQFWWVLAIAMVYVFCGDVKKTLRMKPFVFE